MSCCSRRLQEWLQLAKGQLPSQVGPPIGTPQLSSSCGAVQESCYALLHLHLTGTAIGLQLAGCISTTMSADRVSQECTKHAPYPFGCPGIKHNTHAAGITRPCLRALESTLAVEAAAANTSQQQVTGHSSAATPMTALQLSRAQLLHLQQCFRVRQQALRTLAAQGPVAPATKAGIAKYLDGPGPGCRLMQRGEEGDRQPSSAHMHLIHLVRAG